ncbi:MAG TPA: hypothetical protein VHR42_00800 [Clostridia bacterium]|nr:hypothetical protein [Clostridia bacterium]
MEFVLREGVAFMPYIIWLLIIFLFLIVAQEMPFFSHMLETARTDHCYLLEGFREDDSDIKIAGRKIWNSRPVDELSDARELEHQKENGNLEKARGLVKEISEKIIEADGSKPETGDGNARNLSRLMLIFAAFYSVESCIKSGLLQRFILNLIYDGLRVSLPDFYAYLEKSGAFSLYYLCVRRGADVYDCIGRNYAKLVGENTDESIQEEGKSLFSNYFDVTRKMIFSMEFAE